MLIWSDELKSFFSTYGKVVEHQIIRDRETNRSRGFGFIVFDSEEVVDEILTNGNTIDMAGTQVSLVPWSLIYLHVNGYILIEEHIKLHTTCYLIFYMHILLSIVFVLLL